jgi:hypothetical protein
MAGVESEAARGDALFDLATWTLGHEEHLGDGLTGYGRQSAGRPSTASTRPHRAARSTC